jgi:hypothetical protein
MTAKSFEPARIRDLIRDGRQMEVHCHNCAHFKLLDPAGLPFAPGNRSAQPTQAVQVHPLRLNGD